VAILRWPEDDPSRRRMAAARLPRLLLIEPGEVPPHAVDELEDWIRFPLDSDELALRSRTLEARAGSVTPRATGLVLDADGLLHRDGRWVALPWLEARLFALLLHHPGAVVRREVLARAAWPERAPADGRAVDGVIKRLRRRVGPLGVTIHTVAGSGFLVDCVDASPALPPSAVSR
jgi:DNA-binding response OmpR family regulator